MINKKYLVFLFFGLIFLSSCKPAPTEIVTTDPGHSDQVETEAILSQANNSTATPLLTATNTVTETPPVMETAPPCPGQIILPECFEVDVYRGGEIDPFLEDVYVGCGPSGAMVIRFNADIRVTRNLDLISAGDQASQQINFACLSQIDYLEMNNKEVDAANSFYEQKGPDEYYDRHWKKVKLTFVDGTVWEDAYLYDNCCYQSPSAIVEGNMYSCFLPASTEINSDLNEGRLNDFDVTKIIIRRNENCP